MSGLERMDARKGGRVICQRWHLRRRSHRRQKFKTDLNRVRKRASERSSIRFVNSHEFQRVVKARVLMGW